MDERIILNESYDELTKALPIVGKSYSCTLRTILFYDPHYMKHNGINIGGRWVQRPKGTKNPGTWPEFWR
eukprot:3238550-Prorocentrum_lima.AAC.1